MGRLCSTLAVLHLHRVVPQQTVSPFVFDFTHIILDHRPGHPNGHSVRRDELDLKTQWFMANVYITLSLVVIYSSYWSIMMYCILLCYCYHYGGGWLLRSRGRISVSLIISYYRTTLFRSTKHSVYSLFRVQYNVYGSTKIIFKPSWNVLFSPRWKKVGRHLGRLVIASKRIARN